MPRSWGHQCYIEKTGAEIQIVFIFSVVFVVQYSESLLDIVLVYMSSDELLGVIGPPCLYL
jgi:hypothetical protein